MAGHAPRSAFLLLVATPLFAAAVQPDTDRLASRLKTVRGVVWLAAARGTLSAACTPLPWPARP